MVSGDGKTFRKPLRSVPVFIVALNSYLLHQILHKDFDILGVDVRSLHLTITAIDAFLTEAIHLDSTLSRFQVHVEDHCHTVGIPLSSSTISASKP